MRQDGTLTAWNDDRGFGFISTTPGTERVFVHISAFQDRSQRPQLGASVSFEVESGTEGKSQAVRVLPAGGIRMPARTPSPRDGRRPARRGAPSPLAFLAILAFVLLALVEFTAWHVPLWWAGIYAGASIICFIAYAMDKAAAVAGRWRVSESMLLSLGLLGGWPGAILAQQFLRHKTRKTSFVVAFWGTVLLNVVAFVTLGAVIHFQLVH